ncbi:MAG: hypothetical protein QHJ73_00685, partial [Armatimonadota bacterium]|nr:hypothetical protein [Armatimonadota bacterium]
MTAPETGAQPPAFSTVCLIGLGLLGGSMGIDTMTASSTTSTASASGGRVGVGEGVGSGAAAELIGPQAASNT